MGITADTFGIKRIYDAPADDDGCRVLVDRLRPRGVSKADAQFGPLAEGLAATHSRATLLYGARDPEVNPARVLLEFILKHR